MLGALDQRTHLYSAMFNQDFTAILKSGLLLIIYAFFCLLMLQITLQYIPYHPDVAFLRIKQEEMALPYYGPVFYVHVYTSIFVLLAGFTQFLPFILRKHPKLHRLSGWVYVVVVLCFAAPSGLIMGWHANGGWSAALAFMLLSILWIVFTAKAVYHALRRQYILHQQYMLRSFALTLSAITLRAWKYLLVWLFAPRPMEVYRWVAWLGWVVNLAIVEIIIYRYSKQSKRTSNEKPSPLTTATHHQLQQRKHDN
ncbi:MAG: DUF2306 domain-containing protein [Bacteroidota bacterium]